MDEKWIGIKRENRILYTFVLDVVWILEAKHIGWIYQMKHWDWVDVIAINIVSKKFVLQDPKILSNH